MFCLKITGPTRGPGCSTEPSQVGSRKGLLVNSAHIPTSGGTTTSPTLVSADVTLSSNHNATFASIDGPWGLVFDTAGDLWFSNEGTILNSAFGGEFHGQLPDGEWHTDARNSVHSIDDQG
jgi:hypothetical protein